MRMAFEIIKLVTFLWVAQQLLWVGSTWELIANPIKGVEVVLEDGRMYKGVYSRDWGRNHILNSDSGEVVSFKEYRMMSFPANQPNESRSKWRMYTPISFFVFLSLTLWIIQHSRRSTKHINQGGD